MLEQVVAVRVYDFQVYLRQVQDYAARLAPACTSFLITRPSQNIIEVVKLQVAAMWVQAVSGVPTLNGYSGGEPPGYPFFTGVNNPRDFLLFRNEIERWQIHYLPPQAQTCWVRPDLGALLTPNAPLSLELVSRGDFSARQDFVRWSYVGILGRLPRPSELPAAEESLTGSDGNRAAWILQLMETPEARLRAFVEEAYLTVLRRDPDSGGWWLWSRKLSDGSLTKPGLVTTLLTSAEYRNRCASMGGCRPAGDAVALAARIESLEVDWKQKDRVDGALIFLELLGRPTGPEMALYWAREFDAGTPRMEYVDFILSSPEYHALVGDLQ